MLSHKYKFLTSFSSIYFFLIFYFIIHLWNLTLLPIFNDEAIYLDWAWSYTHMPGHLYDSLLDAKQPLLIWIFAFFENFFSDPLYAGRLVSVLIGAITLLGIYKVTYQFLNKYIAIIAAVLYSITPIFVFYNRQALMEASIGCVGIWSFYLLLKLINNPSIVNGALLGIILGLGFFIKSSTLLFIIPIVFIAFFYIVKKGKNELIIPFTTSLVLFFFVTFFLFTNPLFWQTYLTNSRYTYTLFELIHLPLVQWLSHIFGFFEIGFIFITPGIFLTSIIGIYLFKEQKIKNLDIFIFYFIGSLLLEIFLTKFQSQRYLVPFLPFLIIPAAYTLHILWMRSKYQRLIVGIIMVIPVVLSFTLVINPEKYILQLSNFSKYSDIGYIRGQTSGYGILEVIKYIKQHSVSSKPTMIMFSLNAGNPENAINLYSQKDVNLYGLHLSAQFFPDINKTDCYTSNYPLFFVTRNQELSGMDKYFTLEKSYLNPDGKYSIGIYTLKKDCLGVTASLSDIYEQSMLKLRVMKL